jgi:predicted transcriptional regulator
MLDMKNFDTDTQLVQSEPIPAVTELLSFLSYRVQKINQATLLIASYIPAHITIKNHIINSVLLIMSNTHSIELNPEYATVRDISKITTALRQMKDLFEIAYRGGFISEMNTKVLLAEIDSITAFVQEKIMTYCIGDVVHPFRATQIADQSEQKDITDTISDIINGDKKINTTLESKKTLSEISTPKTNSIISNNLPKSHAVEIAKTTELSRREMGVIEKVKQVPEKPENSQYVSLHYKPIKSVSGEDKKERRDAIMRTIRSKGQVTIKDISENINGCSEKTIQRDLQELIQHGVLMREGEKRWAVYKLAMKNV